MNTQPRANRILDFLKRSLIRLSIVIFVLLEVITAVMIIIVTGPERFSRTEPMQAQEQPSNLELQIS